MLTRIDNVILSLVAFSDLLAKATSYHSNVRPITLRDQKCLVDASLAWLSDLLKGSRKPLESHLRCNMIVKTWDGFLFMVRAGTPDLYTVAVAERYELEKWFKPLAKGVVVDVGAYIGTYTVRALKTADLVVAVEPLPMNFKVLKVNVGLNDHARRGDVILVGKAVAGAKGKTRIFIPLRETIGTSVATLRYIEGAPSLTIEADTLDNILQELGVSKVDMLKIDVEGYVFKSLPGMVESLRRTRWLFIELMGSDLQSVTVLRRLGFKLWSRHGANFLFKNENIL